MSVAVRRALYGKMAGDSTLNGLLGTPAPGYSKSIYYENAPEDARFPYVLFQKMAGTPRYAMSAKAFDDEVWLVKGVDESASADGVDGISSRLDALLTDSTLSISGATQLYLRRISDVDYSEQDSGDIFRHSGAEFRLVHT